MTSFSDFLSSEIFESGFVKTKKNPVIGASLNPQASSQVGPEGISLIGRLFRIPIVDIDK
jgi:hypothetical protein